MTSASHLQALTSAESFVDDLANGQWAVAASYLDGRMRAALGPDGLMRAWQGVESSIGAYGGRSGGAATSLGDLVVTDIPLIMGEERLIARVSVDSEAAVAGFYVLPLSPS